MSRAGGLGRGRQMARSRREGRLMRGHDVSWYFSHRREKEEGEKYNSV